MEILSRKLVDELICTTGTPAVTIYIPMHTTASPPHITENQIRFKNLLLRAAEQLDKHGAAHELAKALQAQVDATHHDLAFWENQTPSLLICASPAGLRMVQLPLDSEEYVAVDQQFHLAPVLGLLEDAQEFYVLALAQHDPKLYRGNLYGLQEAPFKLPPNISAALNIDENNQKSENQGTAAGPSTQGAAGAPGVGRGWFNGRGGARNPQEEDRMRFFRLIDTIICDKADRSLPMVLAGIEAETAEYRSISKYPKILERIISGNHTATPLAELFTPGLDIIHQEIISPEHEAAIEEYTRLSGANPERVADDTQNVLSAAEQGRIDKLLATTYRATSDTVRDTLAEVLRITFPEPALAKTLNKAAATVWQMSGRVINLLPEQLPNNSLMVARLRY